MTRIKIDRVWRIIFLFPLFFSVTTFAGNKTTVTIAGGIVHMRGRVMAGACAVSPESEDKNVVMGQVRSNQFHGEIGTWADPVSFSLQLIDCNTAASKQVAMIFNGVADGKDPQVFSAGEGAGAAKGVGIGLFDGQGDLIAPNTRARHSTSLTDGLVTVPFMAKYRSTSRQVTPGDASARVTFSLYYP